MSATATDGQRRICVIQRLRLYNGVVVGLSDHAWKHLVHGTYRDIWFDEQLLNV